MPQLSERRGGVALSALLPKSRILGADEIRITSCCSDWKQCRPGDLYVACDDGQLDGHEYVSEAIERGAVAVLAERLLPVRVPQCLVPDTRVAYGKICQQLAGQPTDQLGLVGVTGTNGKTTTAWLTHSVLQALGPAGRLSDVANHDGIELDGNVAALPSAPYLAQWLARMASNGCRHGVVELSSQALATRRSSGCHWDIAVLTNLRRDHLELHGTLKNYRRAKQRLFEQLKPSGVAVLNTDDPGCYRLVEKGLTHPVLTVGIRSDADITATLLERHSSEQTFLIHAGSETVPVRTRTIGDQHIQNCLAATAVGLLRGIPLTTIATRLEAVESIPGRLERLECGQPFSVFVDLARTPDTLAVALKSVRQVTRGRLLCVYGARPEDSPQQRSLLGRVVERTADREVITSNNPGPEDPLRIAHDILDGYERPGRPHLLPNRARAIHWALSEARPGDSLLIAGKGDETLHVVDGKRVPFDDRQVAQDWLYQVPQTIPFPCPASS